MLMYKYPFVWVGRNYCSLTPLWEIQQSLIKPGDGHDFRPDCSEEGIFPSLPLQDPNRLVKECGCMDSDFPSVFI